jgi:hypothetical protein
MELILADMAQLERRILKCSKDVKTFGEEIEILKKVALHLSSLVDSDQ